MNKRERERIKRKKSVPRTYICSIFPPFSSLITLLTIPLSVPLLVAVSMFDFIGYFHTFCNSFLFCYAYVYSRLYLVCVCRLFDQKALFICPRFFLFFFVYSYHSEPFLRLHINCCINSLQFFVTNKCVVSLCTQLV